MGTLMHILTGALLASCAVGTLATAQTLKYDTSRVDSLTLVVKAGGTTFDSARVVWRYDGTLITRVLKANATDTLRVKRSVTTVARAITDSVSYWTYPKVKTTSRTISARVVAPAPIPTPPPAPPATVPTNGGWAQPIAPATFTTAYPSLTGATIRVNAGDDLQAALHRAQPGDEIVLQNGATFTGNFVLPAKVGSAWIVLRGESPSPAGSRPDVTAWPAATIQTPNSMAVLRTAPGAAHWRIVGLQLAHKQGAAYNYGIVLFGDGTETTLATMPSDIVLDRVWVHGSPTDGNSRCVAFNGARLAVIDSWLTECHAKGFDAQGVGGWNGPGPFLIENNRIEASGQGVMFGGADPRIPNVSPSDMVIRRNYIVKDTSWARGRWTVKAAFELKHGKRVLFEGNVIENHWADAQTGFAILLQGLSDNNTAWAWTAVQDVLITNNRIRNSTSGVNLLSRVAYNGGTLPTNPMSRVVIVNNLFENVGRDPIAGTSGIGVQLLNDLQDVTIANNTFTCACSLQKVLSFDGRPQTRTSIVGNVFPVSTYILAGNATATGKWTLDVFAPDAVFLNNSLPGARSQDYHAGALGTPAGANMAAINAATAGVVR